MSCSLVQSYSVSIENRVITFTGVQFDFISSARNTLCIGRYSFFVGSRARLFLSPTLPRRPASESLSNVLHQWANRFKTIIPRNRKLKMTVADTRGALFPLMTSPLSHSLITTVLWAPDYATVFRYKRLNVWETLPGMTTLLPECRMLNVLMTVVEFYVRAHNRLWH